MFIYNCIQYLYTHVLPGLLGHTKCSCFFLFGLPDQDLPGFFFYTIFFFLFMFALKLIFLSGYLRKKMEEHVFYNVHRCNMCKTKIILNTYCM
jgi:hypothetical protein